MTEMETHWVETSTFQSLTFLVPGMGDYLDRLVEIPNQALDFVQIAHPWLLVVLPCSFCDYLNGFCTEGNFEYLVPFDHLGPFPFSNFAAARETDGFRG